MGGKPACDLASLAGFVLGLATTTSYFELPPPGQNLPLEPQFRSKYNITMFKCALYFSASSIYLAFIACCRRSVPGLTRAEIRNSYEYVLTAQITRLRSRAEMNQFIASFLIPRRNTNPCNLIERNPMHSTQRKRSWMSGCPHSFLHSPSCPYGHSSTVPP
jgi:hypothetical protein